MLLIFPGEQPGCTEHALHSHVVLGSLHPQEHHDPHLLMAHMSQALSPLA